MTKRGAFVSNLHHSSPSILVQEATAWCAAFGPISRDREMRKGFDDTLWMRTRQVLRKLRRIFVWRCEDWPLPCTAPVLFSKQVVAKEIVLIYWCIFFSFASVGLHWEKWHHDINGQCAPVWVGYLSYCVNIQKKTQSQSVHTESKLMKQELHPHEHVLLWLDEATFFTRSRGRPFGPVLWGQFDLSRTLCSVPGVSISIFVLSSVDVDNSGLLT